jgi:integrase
MKARIVAALVKAPPPVPPGMRKIRITDTELTGFILEVWATGGMTFWLKYVDPNRRSREIKIGKAGDLTVEQARKKARELRAQVALTGDPAAERDKRRAVPTFGAFVAERYLPYAKARLRSYRDHESFCRLRLVPAWGNRRLDDFRPADIVDLQRRLGEETLSPSTINRYVVLAKRIFNLALRWEVYAGRNPCQHADLAQERHRERFLSPEELRKLFLALDAEPNRTAAACIALLALTGARKGEALGLRWEDLDIARRTWRVPKSKSGRPRHITLSDAAVAVLLAQPRRPDCPWVFPGAVAGRPIENVRKCWERVKKAASLPPDTRPHDLRHTFASLIVGGGHSLYEVQTLLGHSTPVMTARYAHLTNRTLVDAADVVGRVLLPVGPE